MRRNKNHHLGITNKEVSTLDHTRLLNRLHSRKILNRAFDYALYDRIKHDYYYDYFEIEYVSKNKEKILDEILIELEDVDSYTQRPAYAYYPPKTDLCYRRMVYIPFKDLIIRYAFVIILADLLDNDLSPNCFANRKAKGEQSKISLLEDFAKNSWPNFCEWQRGCVEKYDVLLRTDITSFYDSISHDYLVAEICNELSGI